MITAASDLSPEIKEKLIEELKEKKLVLDDENPIGKGAFGYVYRTICTIRKELGACKVILIPDDFTIKAKEDLSKSVQNEV